MRKDFEESNRPRAILIAKLKNSEGKILYLGKEKEGKIEFELPHVFCSRRSEPLNQIVSALHAQAGIWAEVVKIEERGSKKTTWNESEIEIPCLEIEMRANETRVFLAKGFVEFKWKKE